MKRIEQTFFAELWSKKLVEGFVEHIQRRQEGITEAVSLEYPKFSICHREK